MNKFTTDFTAVMDENAVPLRGGGNHYLVSKGRVAIIGPSLDRACGLATFTSDILTQAGENQSDYAFDHICVLRDGETSSVNNRIVEQDRASYQLAARRINERQYDAVWIQHEFGIFGGEDGAYVVDLAERLAAPLIVTFHTILSEPSDSQRAIIERLVAIASRMMVMSLHGRDLLVKYYGADARLISLIEHGAPDRPLSLRDTQTAEPLILSTFGLLGPGKGLETAIMALSKVKQLYPDFCYRIIGATHPNLVAKEGERYRDSLKQMVGDLGLENQVEWVDKFLSIEDLLSELDRCQIYLTPYHNLQQTTSGTLSYAVALGKAVISTPYIHAKELLGNGDGILFAPGDSDALAEVILQLAFSPDELVDLQKRAYERGRVTVWPRFVASVDDMIGRTVLVAPDLAVGNRLHAIPGLTGFTAMVDGTGMLQHSQGVVPDRTHGYCIDDNARALILMNLLSAKSEPLHYQLTTTFCSFIQSGFNAETGTFRNFMHYDRSWLESEGSEDSNGRTIWSLGHTARIHENADIRWWGVQWFDRTALMAIEFTSPRAKAFAAIGAAHMLSIEPENKAARVILADTGSMLFQLLKAASRPDWTWFETVLGYDNPRLPEALMRAGKMLGRPDWVETGIDALRWINSQQTSEKRTFRAIGSDSFGKEFDYLPFDQQPLEAWSAIDANLAAHEISPSDEWVQHARLAMAWFHGKNDRNISLVDLATGACRDGINPHGANRNCGAESILAFQLAYHGFMQLAERIGRGAILNDQKQFGTAKPVGYPRAEADRRPAPSRATSFSPELAGEFCGTVSRSETG
jgi:glycosyltransferase involved in cell wall biosynthesis